MIVKISHVLISNRVIQISSEIKIGIHLKNMDVHVPILVNVINVSVPL